MSEAKVSRCGFGRFLALLVVFAVGYGAGVLSPPPAELLERSGLRGVIDQWRPNAGEDTARSAAPAAYAGYGDQLRMDQGDEARATLLRIGAHVRDLRSRIDSLRTELKESRIAQQLLLNRGEDSASQVSRRMLDRHVQLEGEIARLDGYLKDALQLESRVQLLVDASAGVGTADEMTDAECLMDARALLARMDLAPPAPGGAVPPAPSAEDPAR